MPAAIDPEQIPGRDLDPEAIETNAATVTSLAGTVRDTGSQVQTAAADILQNQSYERGMMHTWLQSWGESTAPPSTVMGWMGMEMAADMMPGLATDEEMRELALAEGLEKGRMFLELMRTHHVGGVHMAEAATGAATAPVRQIAAQAALVQAYEIEIFDELLATSYA